MNDETALIGDFNDWQPQAMTKGDDGDFRTEVELPVGEYRYRFRVRSKGWFSDKNCQVESAEPYTTAGNRTATQVGLQLQLWTVSSKTFG